MELYRGILICFSIAFPITVGAYFNHLEIGLPIAFGAFWSSPSDVNGSRKHLRNGILIAAVLTAIVSLLVAYIPKDFWILIPAIGILMFAISYLSVFGFRASLISFSGLFALVLSFGFQSEELHPVLHSLLIGLGGVWYLVLALGWYKLIEKKPIDESLDETLQITAEYIQTRSKLVSVGANRSVLFDKLYEQQIRLAELHESLREMLISKRQSFGRSGYYRKRMLMLIELIDIYELAMANPVDYEKMDRLFQGKKEPIDAFQKLLEAMSIQLNCLTTEKKRNKKAQQKVNLRALLENIRIEIEKYAACEISTNEGILILQNYYRYQEHQIEFIEKISSILNNEIHPEAMQVSQTAAMKFLSHDPINVQILKDNFTFKSVIFKHALRLAVVAMVGFWIGTFFKVQNPYWILLTIIVILRPNYGLTKTRAKHRIVGTIIGGILALGIVYFIHNDIVYTVLSIVTMILSFVMFKHNYQTAAAFVTLNVVFVYALLEPNVWDVIQFRVLDTIIGAGLSTLGILLLWPTWEVHNIHKVIAKSIENNSLFLREIANYYTIKGKVPTSYPLARKAAFLGISDLSTAFQRMAQEPDAQKNKLKDVYALVSLNNSFLSSLASLSTFIQSQPTTAASEHFLLATKNITENLDYSIAVLKKKKTANPSDVALSNFLKDTDTTNIIDLKEQKTNIFTNQEILEAHLVVEQLKELFALSTKIKKKVVVIM